MSSDIHPPDKWLSFGLAFVGGFGDAAGFLLAKTFTGHITGSLVLGAIAAAARDGRGALAQFSATACFLAGIPLSVGIARLLVARPSWLLLPAALIVEVILITAAYFALAFHLKPGVEIFVVCVSLALGLQNGAFRRTGGISVHTNYLTGMITGLLAREAESLAFPMASRAPAANNPPLGLLYGIWGAFLVGAGTGAAMVFRFKERGILAVVLLLFGLIVRDLTSAPPTDPAT
jgi:uncharacterized membrane protein YoaK (UPF0700 family)